MSPPAPERRWLGIRTRLAVSYGLVMIAVLTVLASAVGAVHERLGLARVDTDLAHAMRSAAGVVNSEITERRSLAAGALEAMIELELPGVGVSVLDEGGRQLATRHVGAPALNPERQMHVIATDGPRTLEPERLRVAASRWRHRSDAYTVVVWTALAPLDRDHATVMNTVRIAIPIAALAALAGGWLIVWRALRPLSQTAAYADAIDPRHLDARLPVPGPHDELRRLTVAFNGVLDRLASSVGVQRRFMTDASHELRTPVSVARTAAQVTLAAPSRTEAEYREALGIVASQTERLTRVVDDMFMLALADVDGRTPAARYLYFDEVVTDCVRAAAVLGAERGVSIVLEAPEGVQMRGDDELLRRMVMNLLDNAVRYSSDGSVVVVTVAAAPGQITLTVDDAGPGIPEASRDRVFERFVRLETARPTVGGGLGLPIARWIAEQHGGSLRLESSPHGSRFVAILGVGGP
jgi:two-component system, OmpR family, sensor kinase